MNKNMIFHCCECGSVSFLIRTWREGEEVKQRRYQCSACQTKFNTIEIIETKQTKRERLMGAITLLTHELKLNKRLNNDNS
jgi:transcriptional regulator NrdR family protein